MRELYFEVTTGYSASADPSKMPVDVVRRFIEIKYAGTPKEQIAANYPFIAQLVKRGVPFDEAALRSTGAGKDYILKTDPWASGAAKAEAMSGIPLTPGSGAPGTGQGQFSQLLNQMPFMRGHSGQGLKALASRIGKLLPPYSFGPGPAQTAPAAQKALPAFGTYPTPVKPTPPPTTTGPLVTPPPQTGAPTYPAPGFPTTRPMAVDPFAQARSKVGGAQGAKELNPFLDDLLKQIWASKNLP